MVSYGDGEPLVPFTLIKKSENYEEIYISFNNIIKKKPCVIFAKEKDNK